MVKINYYLIRYRLALVTGLALLCVTIFVVIFWQFSQTKSANVERPLVAEAASASGDSGVKLSSSSTGMGSVVRKVAIDVKGGVHRPGVYVFKSEPIVEEVVNKAGGLLATVDQKRLNLAAKVVAGSVLYIPVGAETVPEEFPLPSTPQTKSGEVTSGSDPTQPETAEINLNQATATQLMELPGIGEKRAQDIISQRDILGGFKSVEDLKQVSGIGDKTFAKLAPLVTV